MSVIWSGVTAGGAIVPVQVTDEGKVVSDAVAADPLWEKNGESLHPVVITDDVATGGAFRIWGTQRRYAEIVALPDAGDVTLTLPSESGTLALEGASSGSPGPAAFAYWDKTEGKLSNEFNILRVQGSIGQLTFFFVEPMVSNFPVVVATGVAGCRVSFSLVSQQSVTITTHEAGQPGTSGKAESFSLAVFDSIPAWRSNASVVILPDEIMNSEDFDPTKIYEG